MNKTQNFVNISKKLDLKKKKSKAVEITQEEGVKINTENTFQLH